MKVLFKTILHLYAPETLEMIGSDTPCHKISNFEVRGTNQVKTIAKFNLLQSVS